MGSFKKQISESLKRLTGYETERFDGGSIAFINRKNGIDAWFSQRAQIRSVFERFDIDLVIDVGASKGRFARRLRPFYPGQILSFEPVASSFNALATASSSDPNWQVHKFALGSEESIQTLYVSGQTSFSSLLKANEYCAQRFGGEVSDTKEETVAVRRLENLLDELVPGIEDRRIFIKIDTQGYDIEVFKGLGNKLEQVVALMSEVSLIPIYAGMPHWTENISAYEKAGFGVVGMFPVTRDSGRVIEYDCLLTRIEP